MKEKLKKIQELLDAETITQEEYDTLRAKIIRDDVFNDSKDNISSTTKSTKPENMKNIIGITSIISIISLAILNIIIQSTKSYNVFFDNAQYIFWIILLVSVLMMFIMSFSKQYNSKGIFIIFISHILIVIDGIITFIYMAIEDYYFDFTDLFFLFMVGPIFGIIGIMIAKNFIEKSNSKL